MRSLWLYIGVFKLAAPSRSAAHRDAVGRIAVATPLLLIADVQGEAELQERLKVRPGGEETPLVTGKGTSGRARPG